MSSQVGRNWYVESRPSVADEFAGVAWSVTK